MVGSWRLHFQHTLWLERGQLKLFLKNMPDAQGRELDAVLMTVGFIATPAARRATAWRCGAYPHWSFLGLRFDDEIRYAWYRGLLQVWSIKLKSRHVSRLTELSISQFVPWWWRSVFVRFLACRSPGMSTKGGRWASRDVDSFWGIFGAVFLVWLGLGCRMGWGWLWGRVQGVDLHVLQRGWGDATITSGVNIFKTSSHSFQKT